MEITFFNREIENPVLKVIIAIGAVVFAAALIALILAIIIPVLGAVLTGVLLIVAVVLVIALLFVPLLSFLGVVAWRREKGSGTEATEVLELEPFNSLKTSGAVKARVTCGSEQHVTVTTDDNLLDSVEAVVRNGRLEVRHSHAVTSRLGLRLDITVPELESLKLYGASDVTVENISGESFAARISGAASVRASGQVNGFSVKIAGAGKIRAAELVAGTVEATIAGAGSANVHATEKLRAKISGAGRVSCSGNPPVVEKHISGAGRVSLV